MNCPACKADIPPEAVLAEAGRIRSGMRETHSGGKGRPRQAVCSKCGQKDNPKCRTCQQRKWARARREMNCPACGAPAELVEVRRFSDPAARAFCSTPAEICAGEKELSFDHGHLARYSKEIGHSGGLVLKGQVVCPACRNENLNQLFKNADAVAAERKS